MLSAIKDSLNKYAPFMAGPLRAGAAVMRHQVSKRRIKRLIRDREQLFLEIGAGNRKGANGWLTIDVTNDCDIFWDLRKGLPFPDESVSKIYSSHFLEHLSFREGRLFLDECKRVLIPGGVFSICVPNARLYIEAYVGSHSLDALPFFAYDPAYNNTTKIDYVNYMAYMDGHHKYMFDEENLLHILQARGFRNARLRQFDPKLDLKARDFASIYAEAEK